DIVIRRSQSGKNFGVALIPEGLIEFIPEMKSMIADLNDTLAHAEGFDTLNQCDKIEYVLKNIKSENADVFASLPVDIQEQLLMDRDPHGNVQVSRIETEKMLAEMVAHKVKGQAKFSALTHFFGYEGRCAFPSNFDADYCYSLGYNAFGLIQFGLSGYLSSVRNLTAPASEWIAGGIPLTMMMNMEKRHGEMKPVIQKALVELEGPVFKKLQDNREAWAVNDEYVFVGAIQYYGSSAVCDITTQTLKLERKVCVK
ncbi:MAG: hypothetical protein PHE78_04020, partial [Candidatus Gastranaerophilales bacterium]|nr:hypothetical protein [Candidatus Gastranaerophilales bacterium]